MDTLELLKLLVKERDERALVLAYALLYIAETKKLELPDWVSALAGLTDPEYLDVIEDFMKAEEEVVSSTTHD